MCSAFATSDNGKWTTVLYFPGKQIWTGNNNKNLATNNVKLWHDNNNNSTHTLMKLAN